MGAKGSSDRLLMQVHHLSAAPTSLAEILLLPAPTEGESADGSAGHVSGGRTAPCQQYLSQTCRGCAQMVHLHQQSV